MHDNLARRINAAQLRQSNDSGVEARVTIDVTTLKSFSGYAALTELTGA